MVFGGVGRERIQLNEDTLWSGGPRDWNNPKAREVLAEVRELLADGKYVEATELAKRMMGPYTQSYLSLGDLIVTFDHGDLPRDYRRQLDLGTATADVAYQVGAAKYTREVFVVRARSSALVLRIRGDRPGIAELYRATRQPAALSH